MHRAISGDLQNEEEMDRAMEEAGEEGIYQVRNTVCSSAEQIYRQNIVYSCTYHFRWKSCSSSFGEYQCIFGLNDYGVSLISCVH